MYIIEAIRKHAEGHIAKHKANIIVYLNTSVGIGEHSDIVGAIEAELKEMAKWEEHISMLDKHFNVQPAPAAVEENDGSTAKA